MVPPSCSSGPSLTVRLPRFPRLPHLARLALPTIAAVIAFAFTTLSGPRRAFALDDCPDGSVYREINGYSFCEASVCQDDLNCGAGQVCRPIPLCIQVGTVEHDGSGPEKHLVAVGRCGPDRTCSSTSTCSELGRCITKAAADRLSLTGADAAPPAAAPDATLPKKSCSCDLSQPAAVGAEGAVTFLLLAVALLRGRTRRRI